jgi:hypothetical protein
VLFISACRFVLEPDFDTTSSGELLQFQKAPILNSVSVKSSEPNQVPSGSLRRQSDGRARRQFHRRAAISIVLLLAAILWLGSRSLIPVDPHNIATPTLETSVQPSPSPLPRQFPNFDSESQPNLPNEEGDLSFQEAVAQCWPNRKPDESPGKKLNLVDLSQVFGHLMRTEVFEEIEHLQLPDGRIRQVKTKSGILSVAESDDDGLPQATSDEIDITSVNKASREKLYREHRKGTQKVSTEKQLGLLFDASFFPRGAAGTATERDGEIQNFTVRAEGRILKCSSPKTCKCS